MLLVIDIGNTNLVLGIFEGQDLKHSWRVSTRRDRTSDEYAVLCWNLFRLGRIPLSEVDAIVISSVVPPLNECFDEMARKYFHVEPIFVEPEEQKLMPVVYNPPFEVGSDRIVNAIAAYQMFGGPAIILDFGTATTFDAVSGDGTYLGGIIAPGIGISAEALFARAAKLPRIEIKRPARTIGDSTVGSMQSGLYYGYVGLVEGILKRMRAELGEATVTATGGFARLIGEATEGIDRIEENLTVYGLKIYYDRVYGSSAKPPAR